MQLLARRFTKLLEELFTAFKFKVQLEPQIQDVSPDLYVTTYANVTAVVEVKLYRSQTIGRSIIRKAADQAEFMRQKTGAGRCILAINSRVDSLTRAELSAIPNLVVYDYDVLAAFFRAYPNLSSEFNSLMDEAFSYRTDARSTAVAISDELKDLKELKAQEGEEVLLSANEKGKTLYEAVINVPVGKPGATDFERHCQKCLEYAFEDDLHFVDSQRSSDSGLHRFDLIAKIQSDSEFWLSLQRDFRSRYVIFEFKNYDSHISQKEVYSTEKYLFPTAMRSTAILIARNGADSNAKAVARGALRENGKLIILLSVEDIRKILDLKDKGDDPSQIIATAMDEMLIGLER